jgi:hypothetical protein
MRYFDIAKDTIINRAEKTQGGALGELWYYEAEDRTSKD